MSIEEHFLNSKERIDNMSDISFTKYLKCFYFLKTPSTVLVLVNKVLARS